MQHFTQTLLDIIAAHLGWAYAIVFTISLGEALFVFGLFVPSTVVLLGVGALVGTGQLPFVPVLFVASAGAAAGDAISFWIGHHYKAEIRNVLPFSRYQALLAKGEAFFAAHGGKSIFLGRFVPGIKSIVPGIAGISGMNFAWFSLVNVVSAVAWAAAHIVPAAGIGGGLAGIGRYDPRLAVLGLVLIAVMVVAYVLARLLARVVIPRFERWRTVWLGRDVAARGRLGRAVHRLLANENGIVGLSVMLLCAVAAMGVFGTLLVDLLFDPELTAADGAIHNWLQLHRSDVGDRIMTAVTMAGDGPVLTALATAFIGSLLLRRHFRVAISALTAIAASSLFVPFLKNVLQRARPVSLYADSSGFSFPSGHSTNSMTLFGIVAALYASHLRPELRTPVFAAALFATATIAFSRLYLGAHWPSDVAAGVSFGLAMTIVFLLLTRRTGPSVDLHAVSLVIVPVYFLAYGFHLYRDYQPSLLAYAAAPISHTVTRESWLAGDWRKLPQARMTLGGDEVERFFIQTDLPPVALTGALAAIGWRPAAPGTFVDALLPSATPLGERDAAPLLHAGAGAALVFTKASPPGRLVLRFWPSLYLEEPQSRNILVGAVSVERLDPWIGSLSRIEDGPAADAVSAELSRKLAAGVGLHVVSQDAVMLVTAP